MTQMPAAGATDVGRRDHNEDAFFIDAQLGLMMVTDGVGGHEAGAVASSITGEVISREVAAGASLQDAIRRANHEVMVAVEHNRGKQGMASTVVAVHCSGPDYHIAWVGDSRAYLWDGQLKLLTRDHSYVQSLLTQGRITLAQARDHPRKNVIVQAIGLHSEDNLQVDENRGSLWAGQMLLLCSDGLSDVVDSAAIADILSGSEELQDRCQALVSAALQAGGRDNISVLLVAGMDQADTSKLAQPTVFWSFDPASGEYSGLPEIEPPSPAVRRVLPKGASEGSVENTQLIPADKIVNLRRPAAQQLPRLHRRRQLLWLLLAGVVVAGVVVASLLYNLDIAGAG